MFYTVSCFIRQLKMIFNCFNLYFSSFLQSGMHYWIDVCLSTKVAYMFIVAPDSSCGMLPPPPPLTGWGEMGGGEAKPTYRLPKCRSACHL